MMTHEFARRPVFYGDGLQSLPSDFTYSGRLIVVEGPDNVGRSTILERLHRDLELRGHGVSSTGFRRSELTREGLEQARLGTTFSPLTMSLFYATDFADRLERQIVPALKAGFWVLSDRYFYSIRARDVVRGANPDWSRSVYGFALVPDMVIYLRAGVDDLVARAVAGRGFDYWESGMDMRLKDNLYESFREYQGRLVKQFDAMAPEYGFRTVNASRDVETVYADVLALVTELEHKAPSNGAATDAKGNPARKRPA